MGWTTPLLIDVRAMCESQALWRDAGAPGAAHQEPGAAVGTQRLLISVWKSGGSALVLSLQSVLLSPYPLWSH